MRQNPFTFASGRDLCTPFDTVRPRTRITVVTLCAASLWLAAVALWALGTESHVELPYSSGGSITFRVSDAWVSVGRQWLPSPRAKPRTRSVIDESVKTWPGVVSAGAQNVYDPVALGRPLKAKRAWVAFRLPPLVLVGLLPLSWLGWQCARASRPATLPGFPVGGAGDPPNHPAMQRTAAASSGAVK